MTGWEGNHRLIDAGECVPASPLGAPVSVQDVSCEAVFVVSPMEVLYPGLMRQVRDLQDPLAERGLTGVH